MKHSKLVIILITITISINAQDKVNYQQMGSEYFMDNLYNPELFKNDCNALKFNKDYCIKICLDTIYKLELQMKLVEKFVDQREKIKLIQNDTLLFEKYLIHDTSLTINYSKFKIVERYPFKIAPYDNVGIATLKKGKDFDNYQNSFNCFILRFSTSVKYQNKTYIELWIKQGYYSSGSRIFLEFDLNNKIVYYKISHMCDDWG